MNEIVKAEQGLCRSLNLTEAETAEYTQKVKERNMGYLWKNAEKMDIQAERRMRAEAEKQAEEAEKKAKRELKEAEKKREEAEKQLAEKEEVNLQTLRALVEFGKQMGADKSSVRGILKEKAGLSEQDAAAVVEEYWE